MHAFSFLMWNFTLYAYVCVSLLISVTLKLPSAWHGFKLIKMNPVDFPTFLWDCVIRKLLIKCNIKNWLSAYRSQGRKSGNFSYNFQFILRTFTEGFNCWVLLNGRRLNNIWMIRWFFSDAWKMPEFLISRITERCPMY